MVFMKILLFSRRHADRFAPWSTCWSPTMEMLVAVSFSCLHSSMCKKATGTDIGKKILPGQTAGSDQAEAGAVIIPAIERSPLPFGVVPRPRDEGGHSAFPYCTL
jgi:hypothetical protein